MYIYNLSFVIIIKIHNLRCKYSIYITLMYKIPGDKINTLLYYGGFNKRKCIDLKQKC